MPRRLRHTIPLALCCAAAAFAAPPMLENGQVRVTMAHDQPHRRGAPHQHPLNRVMIYLDAGRQEIVTADGRKTVLEFQPGDVKWSPSVGTHTSEVVSDGPVRIVEIELKQPGNPAKSADCPLHPLHAAPGQAKLEFENAQVRVYRVKIPPHGTLPMHEHVVNKIAVNLTPVDERVTTAAGQVSTVREAETAAMWGGPVKHREENLSGAPIETIVVELKN
jgi:quercetin dioxygenase-like cupin family protein